MRPRAGRRRAKKVEPKVGFEPTTVALRMRDEFQ